MRSALASKLNACRAQSESTRTFGVTSGPISGCGLEGEAKTLLVMSTPPRPQEK
jgi:hypothetical protein